MKPIEGGAEWRWEDRTEGMVKEYKKKVYKMSNYLIRISE